MNHPCRSVLTGALLCIRGAPCMHSKALQVATTLIEGLCACTHGAPRMQSRGPANALEVPCRNVGELVWRSLHLNCPFFAISPPIGGVESETMLRGGANLQRFRLSQIYYKLLWWRY